MAQEVRGAVSAPYGVAPSVKQSSGAVADFDIDPDSTDPELLRAFSARKSFTTSRFSYSGIRVFYRRHAQQDQLPTDPGPIPLLVFIHGLGGSVAQFHPLLSRMTQLAPCLAADLPGCGRSEFSPADWDAYSTDALVELLEKIIDQYREPEQKTVLIGHSMGSALAAAIAHRHSRADGAGEGSGSLYVSGLVAICPPSGPPPEDKVALYRKVLWVPTPLFDLWRAWDSRGGWESASVRRFVGEDADEDTKQLQYRFNKQSRTPVWRRMAWGSLPVYEAGKPRGGLPGREAWSGLHIPVCLVAGESDHITPPAEAEKILRFMGWDNGEPPRISENAGQAIINAEAPVNEVAPVPSEPVHDSDEFGVRKSEQRGIEDITDEDFARERRQPREENPSTPPGPSETVEIPPLPEAPKRFVEWDLLPSPATHALLYTPSTVGVVSGIVAKFLSKHITGRLDLGWQLRYLSQGGKWDVKNLAKWKKVTPVSEPIAGIFRAMKTLREADDLHTPKKFVEQWGTRVKDVIDISHDEPVYDPQGLRDGGIEYHKFPTVSKVPPNDAEVERFVRLVDKVREEQKRRSEREGGWADDYVVGVHCHYGFNRTGYFIVCYLVERCGYGLQAAIDEFAKKRTPGGIRHPHFLDALSLRYSHLKAVGSGSELP